MRVIHCLLALTVVVLAACDGPRQPHNQPSAYSSAERAAGSPQFGLMPALEGSSAPTVSFRTPEQRARAARQINGSQSPATNIESAEAAAQQRNRTAGESPLPQMQIKFNRPQIAYSYNYGFIVRRAEIAPLVNAHVDLCINSGQEICRIVNVNQEISDQRYGEANLELSVAPDQARAFGQKLASLVRSRRGEQISLRINGQDLSRQLVDTEARLRARTVLRDRLMDMLTDRKGTIDELVAAERGVAAVNEEIDQARSQIADMQGRIEFSKVTVSYRTDRINGNDFAGQSSWSPITDALASSGYVLAQTIGFLISLFFLLLPWAVALYLLNKARRRLGWTFKAKPLESADSDAPNRSSGAET